MTLYVAAIVEGQTEVGCVERLLQRVWGELLGCAERLQVLQGSRGNRDALLDTTRTALGDKLAEAYVKLAQRLHRDSTGRGLLLLLLDAEKDCPKELAPRLLHSARQARRDVDIACVLAKRMLENWIVAGASTLAGVNGLPRQLPARHEFEECSGSAWLEAQMRSNNPARKYKKTADAKVLVRSMDLNECRRNCPSFDKLCRELEARFRGVVDDTRPGDGGRPAQPPPGADTGAAP